MMEYGLIGAKLGHSFSKEIHARIADYSYELCELSEAGVESLLKERTFKGINVTIPYKEKVIPQLDWVSQNAQRIGAVNTIVNRNGKLLGYNTDYAGAAALIRHAGVNVNGKKVLILGTGGTSKTLRNVVKDMGAGEIIIVSRHPSGNEISYKDAETLHTDAEIIVNTTPVGMYPNSGNSPICAENFAKLCGVIDVVYNPLSTKLVLDAKRRGIPAEGGLLMLSAQAVYASALFTDSEAEEALIERAYQSVLNQKRNIVLIGMPSSGKTTIGKRLSEIMRREFIDTDDEIVRRAGCSIAEIFAEKGEGAFRALEREIIAQVGREGGRIIATGGGAVLDARNVDALRQNGVLVLLDRPLEDLTATSDRPLSSSAEALKQRYEERYPIYSSVCDVPVKVHEGIEATARQVLDAIGGKA